MILFINAYVRLDKNPKIILMLDLLHDIRDYKVLSCTSQLSLCKLTLFCDVCLARDEHECIEAPGSLVAAHSRSHSRKSSIFRQKEKGNAFFNAFQRIHDSPLSNNIFVILLSYPKTL